MKQKYYFLRVMAECRHAATPLSSYSIDTTLQGFQKRYITLLYLKGLKSYQEKCKNFDIKVDPFSPVFIETQNLLNKIVGLAISSGFWSPIWQEMSAHSDRILKKHLKKQF